MKLLLLNQSRDQVPTAWLERWLRELSRQLARRGHRGLARKELVMVFVTSPEMRRLNRLYREKDYATDVLSFEPADESTVGELVLCLPVIRRQSRTTRLGERGELGYMIVHGVLHLLGYDHSAKADEAEMFALQDRLYATLKGRIGLS
jgi:probable rRNA maturation factor